MEVSRCRRRKNNNSNNTSVCPVVSPPAQGTETLLTPPVSDRSVRPRDELSMDRKLGCGGGGTARTHVFLYLAPHLCLTLC